MTSRIWLSAPHPTPLTNRPATLVSLTSYTSTSAIPSFLSVEAIRTAPPHAPPFKSQRRNHWEMAVPTHMYASGSNTNTTRSVQRRTKTQTTLTRPYFHSCHTPHCKSTKALTNKSANPSAPSSMHTHSYTVQLQPAHTYLSFSTPSHMQCPHHPDARKTLPTTQAH